MQPPSVWQKPRLRRRGCRLLVIKRVSTVSLLLAGGLAARSTDADTINWLGSVNNLFDVAANWSAGRVPTAGDTAFINAATVLVNGITINPDAIDLNNGSTLDLQNSPTLNVANLLFTNSGGNTNASNLYFEGDPNITPIYTLGSGVTLTGNIGGIGNNANYNGNASTLNSAATINANVSGTTTTIGSNNVYYVSTFTNTGSITASNGNNLNLNAATFTNDTGGSLTIASGSAATVNSSTFQQTGSTAKTVVDGTITLSNPFALKGGSAQGNGTYIGDINNTGGTVTAGSDTTAGHLTITGNYTQDTGGALLAKLGGTAQGSTFDLLSVSNTVALNGKLEVELINNFTAFVGETFDFLTYQNRTGDFASVLPLNGPFNYSVTYNDASGIGTIHVEAVPEAGTVVSLSILLMGAGCVLCRTRRQSEDPKRSLSPRPSA